MSSKGMSSWEQARSMNVSRRSAWRDKVASSNSLSLKRTSNSDGGPALTASAVEFILEGLHVENRLNRSVKQGEITFKR